MSPTKATEKQMSYIVSLYNRVHGERNGYLSQCKKLGIGSAQMKRGLTKAEASAIIDDLLGRLGEGR